MVKDRETNFKLNDYQTRYTKIGLRKNLQHM